MAKRMTEREYNSFLRDRARTATLATVRADGRPHAAPVWFDIDGVTQPAPAPRFKAKD